MWLVYSVWTILGLIVALGGLFLIVGGWMNYLDYKQEGEMASRMRDTLNGSPNEIRVGSEKKEWIRGLEKLDVYIEGVEDYESELLFELRELITVTLPEIAAMDVSVDLKAEYGGKIRREIEKVIRETDIKREKKMKADMEYLVNYGLGERVKN